MSPPSLTRKPKTHFPVVPVAVAQRAARDAAKRNDGPSNFTFEHASGKLEPYSFRPEAIQRKGI